MSKKKKLNTNLDESLKKLKEDSSQTAFNSHESHEEVEISSLTSDSEPQELKKEFIETNDINEDEIEGPESFDKDPESLDEDLDINPNEDLSSLADRLSKEVHYKMGDILVEDESESLESGESLSYEEDVEWVEDEVLEDDEIIKEDEDPYLDNLDYDSDNPYDNE